MKKLLVVLTVLSLVSIVSATPYWQIDGSAPAGEVTIGVGETLSVDVLNDVEGGWLGYVLIDDGGIGSTSAMEYAAAGDQASVKQVSYSGFGYGSELTAADTSAQANVVPDVPQFTVDYSSNVEGTTNLTLYEDTSPVTSMSVNVVPEPLTIGLLGLGGLFIRRRKA